MGIQFGGDGNDFIVGDDNIDLLIGFAGDDTIRGGDGIDVLIGNDGNDALVGDKGNDQIFAGEGDDLIVWNNGDGSDLMEGGNGLDTVQVNGSVTDGDNFSLSANGHRAKFQRLNLGLFELDVDDVEEFHINGGGGNDTLMAGNLSTTDVEFISFAGGDGDDLLDASTSTTPIDAYGNKNSDTLIGGFGNDTLWGGKGHDSIRGGEGIDVLSGNKGNDTIVGDKGNDNIFGGDGNDRIIWNNGDGSDLMEGGQGLDVVEVNGSVTDGDNFSLSANGDHAKFQRLNLGLFELDVNDVEQFEINGGGGNDTLNVENLEGTDVELVSFSGGDGDDILDASNTTTPIFAQGDAGDDNLFGGAGNDTLIGGEGDDVLIGGGGDDVLIGNSFGDLALGVINTLSGGAGSDSFILANENATYYNDGDNTTAGLNDYAVLEDFNTAEDSIQLEGFASKYVLGASPINGVSGTAIYIDSNGDGIHNSSDELVAVAKDVSNLNLDATYFNYV